MNVDIFKEAKEKVIPTWAKFANDGDSAQGTYVGQIVGQKDGFNNEQVIYQLLQEDESILNVGFGLNKKFIIKEMEEVKFGQIVGFKYKGKITVKNRVGQDTEVKDFGLHQDPSIVNEKWLEENKDNMPEVVDMSETESSADDKWEEVSKDDVPFPNEESEGEEKKDEEKKDEEKKDEEKKEEDTEEKKTEELTDDDKLAVIEKLAKDKLGTSDIEKTKAAVMEKTGVAFVTPNYDDIIEKLKAL